MIYYTEGLILFIKTGEVFLLRLKSVEKEIQLKFFLDILSSFAYVSLQVL